MDAMGCSRLANILSQPEMWSKVNSRSTAQQLVLTGFNFATFSRCSDSYLHYRVSCTSELLQNKL